VVFDSGKPFYLEDTLGARYLDYLLHRPNVPIGAFELEVEVQPEKAEARSAVSVQPLSDGRALREYRQALGELRAQREKARAAGDGAELQRLAGQIEALELALNGGNAGADTGKRAQDNVRKAIRVVMRQLAEEGQENGFAEHLRGHLSIGLECLYSQAGGRIWA
jgi:hypothetical protein